MRRGAKPPYRHNDECRKRLEANIKRDDRQRWERYELRRPSEGSARADSDNSDDDSSEVAHDPPVGRACNPTGGEEASEDSRGEVAPADEHGYPMIRGLTQRLMNVDVVEAFSPPRVTTEAKKFGLKPGEAWDLTEGWDFKIKAHREAAMKYQEDHQPLVLIGSPPCTAFSQLQTLNPTTKESQRKWNEGVEHVRFVITLYRRQMQAGRI